MNEEKQTEETNVSVENSTDNGSDVKTDVSVEKTETSGDAETSSDPAPAPDVNVNIDQTFSGGAANAPDPHKNYEAAQPIVDSIV